MPTSSTFSIIFLLLLSLILGGVFTVADGQFMQQKTWCIANPSSDQATLQQNLDYACSYVDCRVLQKGCPCFSPNTLINLASVAMNLYYKAKGLSASNCEFRGSALIVITDPSYGDCLYP